MGHRIIAVTPAGRKAYLELLKLYILQDDSIDEWHLWDNCRTSRDRIYINELQERYSKVKVVRAVETDGSNLAINQFYQSANDPAVFYIKMDDDIVYLPEHFGRLLYDAALPNRDKYTYWSPIVVNNAICSWLLKYHSRVRIPVSLMASAICVHGWKSPYFAEALHEAFISALQRGQSAHFNIPDFSISLARFSINCIGFFGQNVAELGPNFCPLNVDDEEWISAVLPSKTGRPGRLVGHLVVAHFSFFTQERELIKSGMLEKYYAIAGAPAVAPASPSRRSIRQKLLRVIDLRWFSGFRSYVVSVD